LEKSFRERLEYLIKLISGEKAGAFAAKCGLPSSTISNYRRNKAIPTIDKVARIAQATGVSLDWLILGEGPPFRGDEEFVYVPRVDVRLGAGGEAEVFDAEPKEVYAFRRDWLLQRGNPKDMRLAKVVGDSMEPTLKEGDLVLVDLSQKEIIQGQIYAVRLFNGLLVKRLQRLDQNRVRLISDNRVHPPEERSLDSGEFEIIGRVLWVGRNL